MRMDGNIKYFFFCSKKYPTLARSELEHATGSTVKKLGPGLYGGKNLLCDINALGFCKELFELITTSNRDDYSAFAEHIQNSYKIELYQDKKTTTLQQVADDIHAAHINPHVALTNPKYVYKIIFIDTIAYLTKKMAYSTDKTQLRKAHYKKHLHPTSLDPTIAKSLLVLSEAHTIHDPFCGVGGIVFEGIIHQYAMSGSDINALLVKKANENIGDTVCSVQNALNITGEWEAIVSDLPYGKNSVLSENKFNLYERFFTHMKKITTRLVLGSDIDLSPFANGWILQEKHTLYVHKSLNRIIHVFTIDSKAD